MEEPRYWFPAKTYGWGWGLPQTWQGWMVFALYVAAIAASFSLFPPHQNVAAFIASTMIATIVLVVVCWLKGEPPRWRWGK